MKELGMLPRERVETALDFQAPDLPPVRIYPAPGGFHEHGEEKVDDRRGGGKREVEETTILPRYHQTDRARSLRPS